MPCASSLTQTQETTKTATVTSDGIATLTETVKTTKTVMVQAVPRPTYPQNWPAYNAAQTLGEKREFMDVLRDLCTGIAEPPQHMGRKRLPLSDAVFAAAFKVYSTYSGRRFMTDLKVA